MVKPVKSVNRKVKLAVFILLVGIATVLSIILKLVFPDAAASAITIGSAAESHDVSSSSSNEGNGAATEPTVEATMERIPIYLVGAVKKPGIYLIERGSYLFELVEQAGGLTEDAASELINLAFCLEANQRIWLPTRQEAGDQSAGNTVGTGGMEWPGTTVSTLVDINRADEAQLDNLPGIGPATAAEIVAYRESQGGFKKPEDLMNISGIKESRFARLKDLICVTGHP